MRCYLDAPLRLSVDEIATQLATVRASKQQCVDEYLHDIELRTEAYLASTTAYTANALPHDYLTTPCDVDVVARNLDAVRACLDASDVDNRRQLAATLLAPVRSDTYARIDAFERELERVLLVCAASRGIIVPTCAALAPRLHDLGLPPAVHGAMEHAVADLRYLDEMRARERDVWALVTAADATARAVPLSKPADVVPVTGLVFSKLRRLENELHTALQHWSRPGSARLTRR